MSMTAPKPTAWELEAELMFAIGDLENLEEGVAPPEELQALVLSCMEAAVEKRDALAGAYHRKQAEIRALKDRALDAEAKARRVENSLERLEDYILKILDMRGEKQIRGEQYRIGWQRNPARVEVDLGIALPPEYVREVPARYEADKQRIRAALEAGVQLDAARLVEGSRRVVIR